MQDLIKAVEEENMKDDIPEFKAGDTVKVDVKVVEGGKERIQVFEGIVLQRKGGGVRETFTVRKISHGIGVERIFPLHSPNIAKIEVVKRGDVNRSKLFYLRERRGKAARVREKKNY
ncbi:MULTISPECIES: 50S ribosomal protein L19 [unclassified Candidatus Frackibacter]|uniref:50S ribosomal protein L19 n=1 Tax=unclassified Candidatus Frackibacter TaxID=2648818 RepID=UPI0007955966|nr:MULTISPECIES: 50S ribosomal protein L19 [unclassified Candidatus Frackibacter]KXS45483.1 MAG: large subunit ribosomal protein L19 [Candidatus Frackibacter sp. T328-2]SDC00817.1 LSU ribosomal protein L19P [Candidatus Frackibacter sp. WG11]SEM32199.1 LSU ribosomal protein L19P [Candidatus Frackibacter sp. WG12]SFL37110.1 LSU ribosomal protein L19P [Candidatus Frackibacter sp. WG13]